MRALKGSVMFEENKRDTTDGGIETFKGVYSLRCGNYSKEEWHEEMVANKLQTVLVNVVAVRYADRGVPLPDLIREGCRGLSHALENFELEGGLHFSTYATRCIRRNIERALPPTRQ